MFPQRNACIRNTPNTVWRRNISSRGTSGSNYRRKEWTGNEKDREKGGREKEERGRETKGNFPQCGSMKQAQPKVFVRTSTQWLTQSVAIVVSFFPIPPFFLSLLSQAFSKLSGAFQAKSLENQRQPLERVSRNSGGRSGFSLPSFSRRRPRSPLATD